MLIVIFLLMQGCFALPGIAQNGEIKFSALSSATYPAKIELIKKYKIPKNYSDKSAQSWYDELVQDRNKDLLESFEKNKIIHDTLLLGRSNGVLKKIIKANPEFNFEGIQLYIDRSAFANAQCYGEGTIMLNLGLFLWIDNDDELAFVIAHELAHQLKNHFEGRLNRTVTMLTASDFKEELKSIKKSEYGKFERYRNLMKGIKTVSGQHSRYKEIEADSLGIILIKNAKFDPAIAANILLKMDKVEDIFNSDKLYSAKDFFENTNIENIYFRTKTKYNGLSTANVTMNVDKELDSIKTHPDCKKRYQLLTGKNNQAAENCCNSLTNDNRIYKERALEEMVRFCYENNQIGYSIHFCLMALQNGLSPQFFNYFLTLNFSKLFYADKNQERFKAANCGAPAKSNLKTLQDFLFNLNSGDIEKLAAYYLNNHPANHKEDLDFEKLMYNTEVKLMDKDISYNGFISKYPNSKFTYLISKKLK